MVFDKKEYMQKWNRDHYATHKEQEKQRCREYRERDKEKFNSRQRELQVKRREKKFGVKVPEVPICMYGGEIIEGEVHFDHDHSCCKSGCSKCFRGFSCEFHNLAEGYVSKTSIPALIRMLQNTGRILESE